MFGEVWAQEQHFQIQEMTDDTWTTLVSLPRSLFSLGQVHPALHFTHVGSVEHLYLSLLPRDDFGIWIH